MNVKLRIREIRLEKGLTQEKVSRDLDIVNSSYRNIESNRIKKFDFEILFKMKDYFELSSIEDLFTVER